MTKQKLRIRPYGFGAFCLILTFALAAAYYNTVIRHTGEAQTPKPSNTYTWWNWPVNTDGYYNFDWNLTPENDPSPTGYFWSHQFSLKNGQGGYFGMQTQGSNPSGKIAIFSIWDALAANGPGYAGTFGGEGEGYSVRIPYQWQPGKSYRLRIWRLVREVDGTWWGAWVRDEASNVEHHIGSIKVPPAWGNLTNSSVVWTEYYSAFPSSCDGIQHSAAKMTNFKANDGTLAPTSHTNDFQRNCPNSRITELANGVRQEMGVSGANFTVVPYHAPITTTMPAPIVPNPSPAAPTPPPMSNAAIQTSPVIQPAATNNQEIHLPQSQIAKRHTKLPIIAGAGGFSLIIVLLAVLSHLGHKKRHVALMRHFPYDFDAHGPRKST